MKRIVHMLLFIAVLLYGEEVKVRLLQKIRAFPPMSGQTVYNDYLKTGLLKTEIEDWYRVSNEDSNLTAIDFSLIGLDNIVKATKEYTVLFYNDSDFDIYALWIDNKTMKVKQILLLAHRMGTSESQEEREVIAKGKEYDKTLFFLKEERRDTEWITPQIKGDMLVNDQVYYEVSADKSGFAIHSFDAKALYEREDRKLNRLYRQIMKKLRKHEKKAFVKIQTTWVDYKERKCKLFLMNATEQEPDSDYANGDRINCLYQETLRRNKDLEAISGYFSFYR